MALSHVFGVLKIDSETRKMLKKEGVTDLESLWEIEEELRDAEEGLALKAVQRKRIILYLDWSKAFYKEHQREPEPLDDFTVATFADYKRKRQQSVPVSEENALIVPVEDPTYYDLILTLLLSAEASSVKDKLIAINDGFKDRFKEWFVGKIQDLMPSQLVEASEHFESEYIEFIERFVERAFLTQEQAGEKTLFPPFLVGGRTQAGKTSFKAICALACNQMQIPLVIITKGVAESKELYAKLRTLLGDSKVCEYLAVPGRGQPKDYMKRALEKFGSVVIADTAAQINRAKDAVADYRDSDPDKPFAVIVDECDDMYRTPDRKQKTEQAYDSLMDMNSLMTLMISATLVPLLVNMKNEHEDIGWWTFIEPLDDYVAVEDMKVFSDTDGNRVFLSGRELTRNSHESIPYCNDKVLQFYEHAVNIPDTKGVLLLDVSCPRVHAEDNIFQKAAKVQRIHSNVLIVAIYGGGISYKTDIGEAWVQAEKGVRISDILEMLDNKHGLERPVFVFGFSKMQRGMSFRSSKRVPSHILLALGDGYSTEGMIQALGRATFNGKHVLLENGFENVTCLTRDRHWDAARAYQHFLVEIAKKVKAKQLDGAFEEVYDWKSDFLHGNKRKCGKNKKFRGTLEDIAFEEAPSDDDEAAEWRCGEYHATEALGNNWQAKAVYDVVVKCATKCAMITDKSDVQVQIREVKIEYDDMWHESITNAELRKQLNWLTANSHLKKIPGADAWAVTKLDGNPFKKRRTIQVVG